jgi:hypothetical protein
MSPEAEAPPLAFRAMLQPMRLRFNARGPVRLISWTDSEETAFPKRAGALHPSDSTVPTGSMPWVMDMGQICGRRAHGLLYPACGTTGPMPLSCNRSGQPTQEQSWNRFARLGRAAIASASDVLFQAPGDPNRSVRLEGIRALRDTGTSSQVPRYCSALQTATALPSGGKSSGPAPPAQLRKV